MNLIHNRKFFRFIELAVKSLMQHKLRAMLSILGIVCGVAAVFTMLSVGEGAKRESLSQIEQLGTRNIYIKSIPLNEIQEKKSRANLSKGLTFYDAQQIKKGCKDVKNIASLRELKASVFNAEYEVMPLIVSCTADYAAMLKMQIDHGRFICDQDIEDSKPVCVIGHSVASSMGVYGAVGNYIRIENSLFKIVGVLGRVEKKTEKASVISLRNYNDMIFIPLSATNLVENTSSASTSASQYEVTELIIEMESAKKVINSVSAIKRSMEVTHNGVEDYQIIVPQELLNQSKKIQRIFSLLLGSIAFISLVVGGIGIMNIMLATISERTKEIGMRRAFGASYLDIIFQFLAESTILTIIGGFIGIFVGLGCIWVVAVIAKWKTTITIFSLLLPLFTSTAAGIFFGLYPAYTAAKMDPIVALRSD